MADKTQGYFDKEIESWTRIGEWFDVAVSESIAGFRLSEIRRLKEGLLSWSESQRLGETEQGFADRLFAAICKEEAAMARQVAAYKAFHDLDNSSTPQ